MADRHFAPDTLELRAQVPVIASLAARGAAIQSGQASGLDCFARNMFGLAMTRSAMFDRRPYLKGAL